MLLSQQKYRNKTRPQLTTCWLDVNLHQPIKLHFTSVHISNTFVQVEIITLTLMMDDSSKSFSVRNILSSLKHYILQQHLAEACYQ